MTQSLRTALRLPAIAGVVVALTMTGPLGAAAQERETPKPNYELAARWTPAKIQKLLFDTSVSPHYAELGDRLWYEYETAQGKHWTLVDPVRKTKAPLFDNAKMAAMLTRVTRIPYDSQHLPVTDLKWTNDDKAIRFMVEVPKDAEIVETRTAEEKVTEVLGAGVAPGRDGLLEQVGGRGRARGGDGARLRPCWARGHGSVGRRSDEPDVCHSRRRSPGAGVVAEEDLAAADGLALWATAMCRLVKSPKDVSTIGRWAVLVGISEKTLRRWCSVAGVDPKASLDLVRVLRAIRCAHEQRSVPARFLGVGDPHTAELAAHAGRRRVGPRPRRRGRAREADPCAGSPGDSDAARAARRSWSDIGAEVARARPELGRRPCGRVDREDRGAVENLADFLAEILAGIHRSFA